MESTLTRLLHCISSVVRWLLYTHRFAKLGFRSEVISPLKIDGGKNIIIGDNVTIHYKTWLAANPLTGQDAQLIIEDGCTIGNFNHIYATQSIVLHKNVLTADKVYISDNLHGYDDIEAPIKNQPIKQNGEVEIGEDSWLGENVCVLGARIGRHCVIGANSVVTKDIPDYSVAVGAPAKIIKRYDFDTNSWKRVVPLGYISDGLGGVNLISSYLPRKMSFKKWHHNDVIKSPIIITPHCIELGENVYIGHHARIQGVTRYGEAVFTPHIILCDGVSIQQNLHLTCANFVEIGSNTAIAANVTITDIHHPYEDILVPIEKQEIIVKDVSIGSDCKIYNNVVILPGVHIGKHVTVGANSLVNIDLPDYCVAVGMPAKVIKLYDFDKKEWIKV